jgi:hypothetical protein
MALIYLDDCLEKKFNGMIKEYGEITGHFFSQIDNLELRNYYKELFATKGVKLRTNRKVETSLITLSGEIKFERYGLRPPKGNEAEKYLKLGYRVRYTQ